MLRKYTICVCIFLFINPLFARRAFLGELIPKNSIGAEIGVWKGDFSQFLLDKTNPKELHLIDPWLFQPEYPRFMYGGAVAKNQNQMNEIFNFVINRFENYNSVFIHRMYSSEGFQKFENDYFDWVYIDGNHTFKEVYNDLAIYWNKVKPGGLVIGDDYGSWGVKKAVDLFVREMNIKDILIKKSQFVIRKP